MPALGGVVRIADADGNGQGGCILQRRQLIAVGRGQTVATAQLCAVDPEPGHAGALQGQQQGLVQICRVRGKDGLVPGPAAEGIAFRQKAGSPFPIICTLSGLGGGAGQGNGIRQQGLKEPVPDAGFVRIHGKAPYA